MPHEADGMRGSTLSADRIDINTDALRRAWDVSQVTRNPRKALSVLLYVCDALDATNAELAYLRKWHRPLGEQAVLNAERAEKAEQRVAELETCSECSDGFSEADLIDGLCPLREGERRCTRQIWRDRRRWERERAEKAEQAASEFRSALEQIDNYDYSWTDWADAFSGVRDIASEVLAKHPTGRTDGA